MWNSIILLGQQISDSVITGEAGTGTGSTYSESDAGEPRKVQASYCCSCHSCREIRFTISHRSSQNAGVRVFVFVIHFVTVVIYMFGCVATISNFVAFSLLYWCVILDIGTVWWCGYSLPRYCKWCAKSICGSKLFALITLSLMYNYIFSYGLSVHKKGK